jgi:DNA-binding HxlR family transcriptional regulator
MSSSLQHALSVVGDRWSLLVVDALLGPSRRFGELAEAIPGIAATVLAKRLRDLEQQGLVVSVPYSERPPRSRYELTADGRELGAALASLAAWGARRGGGDGGDATGRHEACGTPLELRPWCPTCERVVSDDDPDEVRFV